MEHPDAVLLIQNGNDHRKLHRVPEPVSIHPDLVPVGEREGMRSLVADHQLARSPPPKNCRYRHEKDLQIHPERLILDVKEIVLGV